LSILDNQNGNYSGNQCVLDTSQLANSNKFMNYREGYLFIPMVMTCTSTAPVDGAALSERYEGGQFLYGNHSNAFGLKNWYGSIIHSLTVDYNGTTIVQQTPYIGLWNSFRLMTSMSYDDLLTQGDLIGFYPDTASACAVAVNSTGYAGSNSVADALKPWNGTTFNNQVVPNIAPPLTPTGEQSGQHGNTNMGLYKRQEAWNISVLDDMYASAAVPMGALSSGTAGNTNSTWQNMYKSYIYNRVNQVNNPTSEATGVIIGTTTPGVWQAQIGAVVYLKHLHPFFERICLLKGVFLKLTLNLNQSSVVFSTANTTAGNLNTQLLFTGANPQTAGLTRTSVQSPLGGVSPLMVASAYAPFNSSVYVAANIANKGGSGNLDAGNYILSLSVGRTCLNSTQTSLSGVQLQAASLGQAVVLNIPAYSFNPVFETSYLSTPVKKVIYSDVYQYQVLNVASGSPYNNLITNGIANIKSVLILPFYNSADNGTLIPFQSPFDPAGGGPTSPLCLLNQFNVQISGQNAIYNTERFTYEQFANQFRGVNAVNGGQIDGLCSGLVGQSDFDKEYCYYYVNCGRMLPVEEAVPKSVNILGINTSTKAVDLYIFVEYGVEVNLDILTGARV
jgi:hypothetical protein